MKMFQTIRYRLKRVSSVQLAFWGSLLLSLVAIGGVATIGKDGALYVDIAKTVVEQGVAGGFQRFNWPWFSILLAWTHQVTALPLETAAYLLCALFTAGTCALLVDCVRSRYPDAAYWAVLVVLAMPAFNAFRSDIIREHGFWFFSVLALWLALHWRVRGGWALAAASQIAIAVAALFRLEALMLCAALTLWLAPELRSRAGWLRMLQFNALPLLLLLLAAITLVGRGGFSQGRVEYYLQLLDVRQISDAFALITEQFADSLKYKYSKDEAGQIVFFGLLAAILIKFIKLLGPFALPLLSRQGRSALFSCWRAFNLFVLVWVFYMLVLMVFFIQQQFINSRYVSFLNLLVVPLFAFTLFSFVSKYPRLAKGVVVVALLVMTDNVVSLGAKKNHYIAAGQWLASHGERNDVVYYDDPRIGYYAGWGYPHVSETREMAMGEGAERYRYFFIEADKEEAWLQAWLSQQQRRVLGEFVNRKGDSVLVIGE